MPPIMRVVEDLGWIAVGLGALAASLYIFSYLFVFLTPVASWPILVLLPLDSMPEGLIEALTMLWIFSAFGASLALTVAMLFGVARVILPIWTRMPAVYGPPRPPIRR